MLKVFRRPFQNCAYRWALTTSGISVGEGDCSEAQCAELNGDFLLDFSACASNHNVLRWSGDCEFGGDGCGNLSFTVSGVSGSGSGVVNGSYNWITCNEYGGTIGFQIFNTTGNYAVIGSDFPGYGLSASTSLVFEHLGSPPEVVSYVGTEKAYEYVGGVLCCKQTTVYLNDATTWPGSTGWPSEIVLTPRGASSGPERNDRIRSKWELSYDIEATLWTLRSFNRIHYPVYTLLDASPCDGDTKTLLLADKGDSADGCGVAPAEMTITRVCPPDRVGKSALLEDRNPNGATGKRKRQCGCDCLDEVDDRRHTCATKCASAATEGCENIDPAPDDITCRFPEAINCCENTAGKDVPCAYAVEFECDIFYETEDIARTGIAAKQVVLRRECYFEDPCRFVAVGAESSTGGSPVMDVSGAPGAQPVCSSCTDDCLTGCTWDAWTVGPCPPIGEGFCSVDPSIRAYRECYDCTELRFISGDAVVLADLPGATLHPTGSGYIWTGYEILSGSLAGKAASYQLSMSKGLDPTDYLNIKYCAKLEVRVTDISGYPQSNYYCLALRDVSFDGIGVLPHRAEDPCGFPPIPGVEDAHTMYSTISRIACP